eukprot:m.304231 g.304231  ORF g.304231 m.304231 type:complete len:520 (+) comp16700_c0_seq1:151-1710(+)
MAVVPESLAAMAPQLGGVRRVPRDEFYSDCFFSPEQLQSFRASLLQEARMAGYTRGPHPHWRYVREVLLDSPGAIQNTLKNQQLARPTATDIAAPPKKCTHRRRILWAAEDVRRFAAKELKASLRTLVILVHNPRAPQSAIETAQHNANALQAELERVLALPRDAIAREQRRARNLPDDPGASAPVTTDSKASAPSQPLHNTASSAASTTPADDENAPPQAVATPTKSATTSTQAAVKGAAPPTSPLRLKYVSQRPMPLSPALAESKALPVPLREKQPQASLSRATPPEKLTDRQRTRFSGATSSSLREPIPAWPATSIAAADMGTTSAPTRTSSSSGAPPASPVASSSYFAQMRMVNPPSWTSPRAERRSFVPGPHHGPVAFKARAARPLFEQPSSAGTAPRARMHSRSPSFHGTVGAGMPSTALPGSNNAYANPYNTGFGTGATRSMSGYVPLNNSYGITSPGRPQQSSSTAAALASPMSMRKHRARTPAVTAASPVSAARGSFGRSEHVAAVHVWA